MSYTVRSFSQILSDLVADARNRWPTANLDAGGELYMRLAVVAGAVWSLDYGVKYVENQVFPDTADSDNLRRHAATWEVTPKEAQAASDGRVRLYGTNGTAVSAGVVCVHADGTTYTTTEGGTISLGDLVVDATCLQAGTAGNKTWAEGVLTVQSPPSGVTGLADIAVTFSNGSDDETDAQLLERVLLRIRKGNAGGTAADYQQWALAVSGISYAYVLPARRGAGSVDVAVFGVDEDGNRTPAADGVRAEVLAYLDTLRPVTADVDVPALTPVAIDVDVTLSLLDEGLELADVQADVEAAIAAVIRGLAVQVGSYSLSYVQLVRAIASVEGVTDFEINAPTTNVPLLVSSTDVQYAEVGTIVVT